jgi:hypothetical protein
MYRYVAEARSGGSFKGGLHWQQLNRRREMVAACSGGSLKGSSGLRVA